MVWLDLDEDLLIDEIPGGGSIKLQGAQTSLESLNPADLFISADCSAIKGPGMHTVDVRPEVPPGVNVLDWSPERITLNIVERTTEEQ